MGLAKNVKETEDNLGQWEDLRQNITDNKEHVHQEIEKRKKKMLKRIKEHAQVTSLVVYNEL